MITKLYIQSFGSVNYKLYNPVFSQNSSLQTNFSEITDQFNEFRCTKICIFIHFQNFYFV